MVNYVIKRNGKKVQFNKRNIINAILRAWKQVEEVDEKAQQLAEKIADNIEQRSDETLHVEDIHDIIEQKLMASSRKDIAKEYIEYRQLKQIARDVRKTYDSIFDLVNFKNQELKDENSNKNAMVASTQRDYMAGEVSKDITNRFLLPAEISDAHQKGIIHFHDADYFAQRIHNCCLVNLDDMLQNGTVINKTMIEKPHSFTTACTIATQIMAVVASGQYGGQSISLSHLAPFVDITRERIKREVIDELDSLGVENLDFDKIHTITERRVEKEVSRGVQILQYQINTLNTSNGQTPFVTLFIYLGEVEDAQTKHDLALIAKEVFKQRIEGTKNEAGHWITPAFPKLIYVLEEDNITEGSTYYYLTKLAAECTAKRMVPDYISEKVMLKLKGDVYTCMGCRSFLTPDRFTDVGIKNIANAGNYEEGRHKYYGRFNQGVVTINLVDAACSAKDLDDFWNILEERCELCHKALQIRHRRLLGTPSDISPIHWQHGALARLEKGEPIDRLLYNGYSTLSLGYAGLWECVYKLIGKKLTEKEGKELGLEIMKKLNSYTASWKAAENIDYSLYGTPIESTTYKFAKCLKERFGIIEGVTDKNYITNSYHVHVTEKINAFDKLKLEAEFQELSPGGAISYVEVPDMKNNIEAVLSVMKYIYDNIMYAELNTKSDYCQVCGYDGEIEIIEDASGKLYWECPNCGNTDQNKMNVARRTCGYIGSQWWNQGRTQEIKERVLHL